MRVTSKGQVTIPQDLREKYGMTAGTEVEFVASGNQLAIRLQRAPLRREEFDRAIELLEDAGRPMRDRGLTTDELMRLTRGDD